MSWHPLPHVGPPGGGAPCGGTVPSPPFVPTVTPAVAVAGTYPAAVKVPRFAPAPGVPGLPGTPVPEPQPAVALAPIPPIEPPVPSAPCCACTADCLNVSFVVAPEAQTP